jgi:eukaryotic-like serine/threonine-protein kinase
MALETGQIIDAKYKVIRLIGEGGMGTVYEGENTRIARRVAIKVLHAQVAALSDFVARFEREAKAVARIGSQHVCDVLDLGDLPNGDRYIVMEYLEGTSFEDRLVERGKLTPAQLAPIAFELLEGLGTMHLAGVIHRDLKPANIFLSRTSGGRGEVVKILDFGVAKLQPLAGEVGSMTQTGTMMGTPLYMSPEQARGARDVDGRTDLYAASVMFYRALTGQLPYNAETLNELLFKIVLEDPKPLRDVAPEVDEVFAAIVHKGLARELPQRFQSARAFQDEIAIWGKTQGRSSLSFAVTHASDRPPATPITLPDPARSAGGASSSTSSAVTGGAASPVSAAAGTPIAWSESAPGIGSSANLVAAATVLTPISYPAKTSPVAGLAAPGGATPASTASAVSAAPSNATLQSSPNGELATSQPSKDESGTIAQAQTGPVVPLADVSGRPAPAPARSSKGMIFGLIGAGAVAIAGIVAFGKGSADKTPVSGLTATASASGVATGTDPSSAKGQPSTAAASDSAAAPPSSAADATPPAPAQSAELSAAPRRDPQGAPRRTDLTPKATTAPSSAPPPSAVAVAQPPATAPSATTPKPASSARKFRTNLD